MCKETALERADLNRQMFMFTYNRDTGGEMFTIFSLSILCQLFSKPFYARTD